MVTRKNIFTLFLIILLTTERFYASSKNITSLSLDFKRTEKGAYSGPTTMTGKIIYNKSPFYFVFQTITPEALTIYENEKGAWMLQDDTVIEITEQKEAFHQICTDFLNWFKEDYGLNESGFSPSILWLENGTTVSQWDKDQNTSQQPIDHVIVYSDAIGRFTKLNMFVNPEVLFTSTSLEDYNYSSGHYYPGKILSVSYENEKPILTTELLLTNVIFSFSGTDSTTTRYAEAQFIELKPSKDISAPQNWESVTLPQETIYRVSIPSVLVNTSYKFYKKFITNQDMTNCPFYPTCSQYMLEAVSKNGIAGFIQGLERLKRCTNAEHKRDLYPVTEKGRHYDPVPSKNKDN